MDSESATEAEELEVKSNVGVCETLQAGPPDFTPKVSVIVGQIRTLHDFYANAPGPIGQRIRERNEKIRNVFSGVRDERHAGYAAYRCRCGGEKKCASTTGNTKRYRVHIEFPVDTTINAGTLSTWGSGFKEGPTINGRFINFTIGKSGRGVEPGRRVSNSPVRTRGCSTLRRKRTRKGAGRLEAPWLAGRPRARTFHGR